MSTFSLRLGALGTLGLTLTFAAFARAQGTSGQAVGPVTPVAPAQQPAAGAQPAPPPVSTTPDPSAQPQPAAPVACFPECRAGFTCVSGQCVSACNPPCAQGETCTAEGQCLAPIPAAPPPAAPPPAPPPAAPYEPLPPPEPQQTGIRTHDGFYFRFGLGIGALSGSYTFHENESTSSTDQFDFDGSGLAFVSELAFGGSPTPGFVIGGGSYGADIGSTTFKVGNEEHEDESTALSIVGPFIDIYPMPTSGFHIQAAPGFALATASEGTWIDDDFVGIGFGMMAGVGYEAWIGEQWSLGFVGRILYGSVTLEDLDGNDEVEASVLVPGALLVVTYH
jgi:hypothetical protein